MTPEEHKILHQFTKEHLIKVVGNFASQIAVYSKSDNESGLTETSKVCLSYCKENGMDIPKLQTPEKEYSLRYDSPETIQQFEEQIRSIERIQERIRDKVGDEEFRRWQIEHFKAQLIKS